MERNRCALRDEAKPAPSRRSHSNQMGSPCMFGEWGFRDMGLGQVVPCRFRIISSKIYVIMLIMFTLASQTYLNFRY